MSKDQIVRNDGLTQLDAKTLPEREMREKTASVYNLCKLQSIYRYNMIQITITIITITITLFRGRLESETNQEINYESTDKWSQAFLFAFDCKSPTLISL